MNKNKILWGILFFNLIYVILFGIHFFMRGNFEFVWYVFIMLAIIAVFTALYLKFKFSIPTLIGLSVWGLGHMLGGSTLLTKERLYVQVLWPLFKTGELTVFSYDHLMHFYFYIVIAAVVYQIIKQDLKPKTSKLLIAAVVIFTSMGIGALNEIFEFLPVLFLNETGVGGYFNIAWDIVFNALGALATVIYIMFKREK